MQLEKWFPLQGERAHSLKKIDIKSILNSFIFFALLSSSISRANPSCVVATIFSNLAFLSTSVSLANLSCLLATTFSSLRFLSNSFSSPRFNLLRVARRCFSWSFVCDDLYFSSCSFFWFSFLLYLFRVLSSAFLSSVLQSMKLFML